MHELAAPRQGPLIVGGFGDTASPAGRRFGRQTLLTRRPPLRIVVVSVRTAHLEIERREVSQVLAHQAQHLVVLECEVVEAVSQRHPAKPEPAEWGTNRT